MFYLTHTSNRSFRRRSVLADWSWSFNNRIWNIFIHQEIR